MSNYGEQLIKDEYERIKGKLTGSIVYGIPFDENNIMHLIIFAYYAGWYAREKVNIEYINELVTERFPKDGTIGR